MTKDVFVNELQRLVTEYEDKGFKMSKERASQWYEFFKNINYENFKDAVEEVLKTVSYCPTMADLFKTKAIGEKKAMPLKVINMGEQ